MKPRHKEPLRSFLLGILLGATFALLLAPAPGRDTRERIVTGVEHASVETRDLAEKVVLKGREALASAAATLDHIARR